MNSTGVAFAGGFVGGLLGPLRSCSFWTMKKKARSIGEGGMYRFVAQVQQTAPTARVHLMGHSFGCIVVSSICGGPNGTTPLPRPVDSLALVQGALSHWAYADAIPSTGGRGYYNAMMHRRGVRQPSSPHVPFTIPPSACFIPPLSVWCCRTRAALSIRLSSSGARSARSAFKATPARQTSPCFRNRGFSFEPGKSYNLEASQFIKKMSGASGAHSDIDGPQVAHAIWQAAFTSLAATPSVPG